MRRRTRHGAWTNAPDATTDGAYTFDQAAAARAVMFFPRYLRLTDDRWAGKPFVLEAWQAEDIIAPAFGWKRPDGTRRFRRVILWVPRKNGKTELAAGVSIITLIGTGVVGGQVYSLATTKDQARLVFDKASRMVATSPALAKDMTLFRQAIWCQRLSAAFRPLAGTPEGRHGLSVSGLIGDELHEWVDGEAYRVLHESEGARAEPIEFLVSTAGVRGRGYGWEVWEECQAILDGRMADDETLVVIYGADAGDDWTDEAVWRKANPNLGVSLNLDFLRGEAKRAADNPRLENRFRNYFLNQWTEQTTRWLPMATWDNAPAADWRTLAEELTGRPCFIGVDLASTKDLTAAVLVFAPDDPTDPTAFWRVVPRIFVPRATLTRRVEEDRMPFDRWAEEGAVVVTEGEVLDTAHVVATILADAERFDVRMVAVEKWNSLEILNRLIGEGLDARQVSASLQNYTAPSKMLEKLVLTRRLVHGGHPVLRWMAANVALYERNGGDLCMPAKGKSGRDKIDGITGLIIGIFAALSTVPDVPVDPDNLFAVI